MLIKNGHVSHDPKMGAFTVLGSGGKPHVVRLFPKEDCSCPSPTTCYHIIGVKLSLGIPVYKVQKKVNLTQLRWNPEQRTKRNLDEKGQDQVNFA